MTLTTEGRPLAHKVLRRHRVIERLLTDVLGMPWHEVHTEAHRLEHAVSARVEEHLIQHLGFPEFCPHGHPICPVDPRKMKPLNELTEGEEAAVAQISEVKEDLLAYFDRIGIVPGSTLKLLEASPFGGPLTLATDAGTVSVGREIASCIQVCDPKQAGWINSASRPQSKPPVDPRSG